MPVSFFQHRIQIGSFEKCPRIKQKNICVSPPAYKNNKTVKHLVLCSLLVQCLLAALCSASLWTGSPPPPSNRSSARQVSIHRAGGPSSPPNNYHTNSETFHRAGGQAPPPIFAQNTTVFAQNTTVFSQNTTV